MPKSPMPTPCISGRLLVAVACVGTSGIALAQTTPDAGRLLQEQAPRLQPPRESPALKIEPPPSTLTLPGGAKVVLKAVRFKGNTVLAEAQLRLALGESIGQTYDLAGLRSLADRVSTHYREAGYPFARAYLPPQQIDDGDLIIEVVEGRYGSIKALGDPSLLEMANDFLSVLKSSDVIESQLLERATLILEDQPGIKVAPIMRPGKELGTGDLEVYVERKPGFSGSLGLDNHGSRYTGEHRANVNLQLDSPFLPGDQLTVKTLASNERMWMANLGYSQPLGASGWRGNVAYAHTYYELGADPVIVSTLSEGVADVYSVGLSYPLVRSQRENLTLALNWQHKKMHDEKRITSTISDKSTSLLPITLQFDRRDNFGGGGLWYGSASYTLGWLKLDPTLAAADAAGSTGRRGRFDRWNIDVARVQSLPQNLSLYGRLSAQAAGKNLDSSEGLSLGGANGVRAYPSGEGNGDEGCLAQLELRYALGAWNPYVFHDSGRTSVMAKAPKPEDDVRRGLSGAGVGVRYQEGAWSLDGAMAWRIHGGNPKADSVQRDPHVWVTATMKF
jgi:hemolysin activation/secretion protein